MSSTGQVLQTLRDEGLSISGSGLRGIVNAGRIPEPSRDIFGNLIWDEEHVDAARDYLRNPPRRGRRRTISAGGAGVVGAR